MKTIEFTYDGHDYSFLANDYQTSPLPGDIIHDSAGDEVCILSHDGEYYHAESPTGAFARVHENEPDAAWTAVKVTL